MQDFSSLWLSPKLLDALSSKGYTTPTPIQEQSIPLILKWHDMFGCAQTGTGKTAAFSLPIIQMLTKDQAIFKGKQKNIRTLILTPTRELAAQIADNIKQYSDGTNLVTSVIFGWVSQVPQVKQLRAGVDIVIATPGRLLDLLSQKLISLAHIEFFVLDEADRMLDMGFIRDIRKILTFLPNKRQTLFFSATMAPEIMELAEAMLKDPLTVKVTPVSSTVDTIGQSLYTLTKENKKNLLLHLLKDSNIKNTIIFTKTKHGANKVEKILAQAGIASAAIHGNKSQTAREKALKALKEGSIRALVATDIAARGIDISQLSHVIIYDVPLEPESYVHRIGRTGRAGMTGDAMMMCEPEELKFLKQIIKLIGKDIPLMKDHPFHLEINMKAQPQNHKPKTTPLKPNMHPRPTNLNATINPEQKGEVSAVKKKKKRFWKQRF
jgi:ATP-dependent RNA helicase RhlE